VRQKQCCGLRINARPEFGLTVVRFSCAANLVPPEHELQGERSSQRPADRASSNGLLGVPAGSDSLANRVLSGATASGFHMESAIRRGHAIPWSSGRASLGD